MQVRQLKISNFRGVAEGSVTFTGHSLLVGGNNIGKSTVCEALDLVLGPERLGRRPIVDEHDFHAGRYVGDNNAPVDIRIEAILVGLSEEAERRFRPHLRRWNNKTCAFIDEAAGGLAAADGPDVVWALPVVFLGRYSRDDDDFIGNTYFNHPVGEVDAEDADPMELLGGGRKPFRRDHKRLCGFVFLRTLRTGSRALSLQRGSLLDAVLKLAGDGASAMWQETLDALEGLDPAIGDIDQLKQIRTEIRQRMGRFVNLSKGDDAASFFASELTREHLREVVRLFLSAQPGDHPVPFNRLGTGSINLLVFALLTFIAELKGNKSVIFAMEEPEVALAPHTQRRVAKFVLAEMGQSIVTSHSPYVIEQFDPAQIVILNRDDAGRLKGEPIDDTRVKLKNLRSERRQFAEEKVRTIAKEIYRAADISCDGSVETQFKDLEAAGFGHLPVCMAKTQYSFSTDPNKRGAPTGHIVPIRELRLSAGAGFVVVVTGEIMTMPGLPKVPSANSIRLDDNGLIQGLF